MPLPTPGATSRRAHGRRHSQRCSSAGLAPRWPRVRLGNRSRIAAANHVRVAPERVKPAPTKKPRPRRRRSRVGTQPAAVGAEASPPRFWRTRRRALRSCRLAMAVAPETAPSSLVDVTAAALEQRLTASDAARSGRAAVETVLAAWRVRPLASDETQLPDTLGSVAWRRGLDDLLLTGNRTMLRLFDLPPCSSALPAVARATSRSPVSTISTYYQVGQASRSSSSESDSIASGSGGARLEGLRRPAPPSVRRTGVRWRDPDASTGGSNRTRAGFDARRRPPSRFHASACSRRWQGRRMTKRALRAPEAIHSHAGVDGEGASCSTRSLRQLESSGGGAAARDCEFRRSRRCRCRGGTPAPLSPHRLRSCLYERGVAEGLAPDRRRHPPERPGAGARRDHGAPVEPALPPRSCRSAESRGTTLVRRPALRRRSPASVTGARVERAVHSAVARPRTAHVAKSPSEPGWSASSSIPSPGRDRIRGRHGGSPWCCTKDRPRTTLQVTLSPDRVSPAAGQVVAFVGE